MRYAVVGGGIAGLAAAWELSARPDTEVTVFDPGPLGGNILTADFEGRPVDTGPDAFLTRVPAAVHLCAELGLAPELVAPAAGTSMVWWAGRLRPLPEGLVLGVPGRVSAIARSGILSPMGAVRAALDLVLPASGWSGDLSVHDLVARRFGQQVASRLVDPLVGGIHAGRTDELSAAATVPQLLAAARRSRSLLLALRATAPGGASGPAFLTPRDGLGRMVEVLTGALRSRRVAFVAATVTGVGDAGQGRVGLHATEASRLDGSDASRLEGTETSRREGADLFDGAVIATPAPAAASLLERLAPDAAAALRSIEYASVALVTLAYPAESLGAPPGANGFLVPRSSGRVMTACSFASAKWPHWSAPGTALVRLSAGRHHDERAMSLDDGALVDRLGDELGGALGHDLPSPTACRVARWPASFPQYAVGHLDRVADIEAALAGAHPAVTVAGAAYRGAGIPACITSGRAAATALTARRASTV